MKPPFGWVEVYHGSDENECRTLERAAREATIRCRLFEAGKLKFVSMQSIAYNAAAARASSMNLYHSFPVRSNTNGEHVYVLQVKRRDMEKFQAIRTGMRVVY